MRNSPLRAFASPIKKEPSESISDSTRGRHNIRPIEIVKKKKETYNPGKGSEKSKGTLIDTDKRNLNRDIQGNPLATIFAGRKKKA